MADAESAKRVRRLEEERVAVAAIECELRIYELESSLSAAALEQDALLDYVVELQVRCLVCSVCLNAPYEDHCFLSSRNTGQVTPQDTEQKILSNDALVSTIARYLYCYLQIKHGL